MLEFIHHAAIGDKIEAVFTVGKLVFCRLRAEEIFMIILRQKFHAHGVAFAGLDGRFAQVRVDIAVHCAVKCEGVTGLVGQHIDVSGCAVKVREDKRSLVFFKHRTVAAGGLALAGQHVEQLVVVEEVDEFLRLRAELLIHSAACGEDLLRRALWGRVAVREAELVVVNVQAVDADALALGLLDLRNDGDKIVCDLVAEGRQLLLSIAVAAEAVIAELNEVRIAKHAALRIAVVDELVIDLVQLRAVCIKDLALGLVSGAAYGTVGADLVLAEHRHGHGLAVKFHGHVGIELLIAGRQAVFLLHKLHKLRLEAAAADLELQEQQAAVVGLQLRAELRVQHGLVQTLEIDAQLGPALVEER